MTRLVQSAALLGLPDRAAALADLLVETYPRNSYFRMARVRARTALSVAVHIGKLKYKHVFVVGKTLYDDSEYKNIAYMYTLLGVPVSVAKLGPDVPPPDYFANVNSELRLHPIKAAKMGENLVTRDPLDLDEHKPMTLGEGICRGILELDNFINNPEETGGLELLNRTTCVMALNGVETEKDAIEEMQKHNITLKIFGENDAEINRIVTGMSDIVLFKTDTKQIHKDYDLGAGLAADAKQKGQYLYKIIRYSVQLQELEEGKQYSVHFQDLTLQDAIRKWIDGDEPFEQVLFENIQASNLDKYRIEFPPFTNNYLSRTFEFTLTRMGDNLKDTQNPESFKQHFSDTNPTESFVSFPNLNKDALLIAPHMHASDIKGANNSHISAFLKSVEPQTRVKMWQKVGQELEKRLLNKPTVWLSTHGTGVPWLHIRLDDIAKYFVTDKYKKVNTAAIT
jgi:hypothetical protein